MYILCMYFFFTAVVRTYEAITEENDILSVIIDETNCAGLAILVRNKFPRA